MQVVHRDRILNGVHPELVCPAVDRAAFDASAGEPYTETGCVVIATVDVSRMRSASHLARPQDESLLEEAPLFEIRNEGGYGLVRDQGVLLVARFQIRVLVPASVVESHRVGRDFHKAHPGFDKTSGTQALRGIETEVFVFCVQTVQFLCRGGFLRKIQGVGNGGLHAERHFIVSNRRFDLGMFAQRLREFAVLLEQPLQLALLFFGSGGDDVFERWTFSPNRRCLIAGRQIPVGKVFLSTRRHGAAVE